jgi:hypothetical protein
MPSLQSMIPDAETALALEPEELGGVLLRHLGGLAAGDQNLNRHNFAVYAKDNPSDGAKQAVARC